jgi:hypothetical protein
MIELIFLFLSLNLNLTGDPKSQLVKIASKLPQNCFHEFKSDSILTITQRDTFFIQSCGIHPLRTEVIHHPYNYQITIEATSKLSDKEINKRIVLQDSLLQVLKLVYEANATKANDAEYNWFLFNRNEIDSLRVPIYSDQHFSYFYKSNFPRAYCFVEKYGKSKDHLISIDIHRLLRNE